MLSNTLPDDLLFLRALAEENDYRDTKRLPDGRYAAIFAKAFTVAIISGQIGDRYGFDHNWCYHDYFDAKSALDAWDGTGEPSGWHRHMPSGRRLSVTGEEIDGEGNRVDGIGKFYVRP